jgi:hypothetical protein
VSPTARRGDSGISPIATITRGTKLGGMSQTTARRLAVVVLVVLACAAACSAASADPRRSSLPYPKACDAYGFSERRCEAIVADGIRMAGVDERTVRSIEFIPNPTCGPQPDGSEILCNRTVTEVAYLRIRLRDGSVVEQSVFCGIDAKYRLACTETPEIAMGVPISGGYADTPEHATPLPEIDPEAAADAEPLEVASMTVPVDHVGRYEVEVGEATVPNGILSETSFILATPDAHAVTTDPNGVWLEVRPSDPGRPPFENKYARGWIDGVEPVRVYLVFTVLSFEPGARLEVVDLTVR